MLHLYIYIPYKKACLKTQTAGVLTTEYSLLFYFFQVHFKLAAWAHAQLASYNISSPQMSSLHSLFNDEIYMTGTQADTKSIKPV